MHTRYRFKVVADRTKTIYQRWMWFGLHVPTQSPNLAGHVQEYLKGLFRP